MLSTNQRKRFHRAPSSATWVRILSSQVWSALEYEQQQDVGREILALLCPDWRQASMVLSAHDGTIVYANWRCLQLLESGDFCRSVGGRLDFWSRARNQSFRNDLHEVAGGMAQCAYLAGRHAETERPFLVTLHGCRGFLREVLEFCFSGTLDGASPVIAEIALNVGRPDSAAISALASEFGLSRAESQLMQLFACGLTLEEIADRRGVSINTARQQMKAVLNKTNSDRQQDLMRLVYSLCPGYGATSSLSTAADAARRDSALPVSRLARSVASA